MKVSLLYKNILKISNATIYDKMLRNYRITGYLLRTNTFYL